MRVLQIVGSSVDDFMFKLSWFWGENCPSDILGNEVVHFDYAIMVPPEQTFKDTFEGDDEKLVAKIEDEGSNGKTIWYFIDGKHLNTNSLFPLDGINENQFLFTSTSSLGSTTRERHPNLPNFIKGPLELGEIINLLEGKPRYSMQLPQCMDFQGMTTIRQLFENMLHIPHPGPTGMTNFLAQNKALTRSILQNVPGVKIPKGELLYKKKPYEISNGIPNRSCHRLELEYPKFPSLPLPFIVKPAEEDNSRGVSLCRNHDDVIPAIDLALGYGDCVIIEEFIPGRELRAGCFEDDHGVPRVPSCKLEFVMEKPIRETEDKFIEKKDIQDGAKDGHLVLKSYDREFLIPGAHTKNVPAMPKETLEKIDKAVVEAHKALGCRDFSMFDFRVDERTGEPYIIESCSFWNFTPVSVISVLIDRSKEFFDRETKLEDPNVQVGCWKKVAKALWERTAQRKV